MTSLELKYQVISNTQKTNIFTNSLESDYKKTRTCQNSHIHLMTQIKIYQKERINNIQNESKDLFYLRIT